MLALATLAGRGRIALVHNLVHNVAILIPSCDCVAHVFLGGLVGSAQDWRAESRGFESGPGKKKKKGFFSHLLLLYIISKDGCEKGRVAPRSWT